MSINHSFNFLPLYRQRSLNFSLKLLIYPKPYRLFLILKLLAVLRRLILPLYWILFYFSWVNFPQFYSLLFYLSSILCLIRVFLASCCSAINLLFSWDLTWCSIFLSFLAVATTLFSFSGSTSFSCTETWKSLKLLELFLWKRGVYPKLI